MGVVEKISTALDGQLALDYLCTKNEDGEYPSPNIIFLDINMPVMDGYQFLEAYDRLERQKKSKNIIVMLSTSIREIDINRAKDHKTVIGYQFKPLTYDKVNLIIEQITR